MSRHSPRGPQNAEVEVALLESLTLLAAGVAFLTIAWMVGVTVIEALTS